MIPKFRCFIDGIGIVGVKAIYFDSEQIILEPFNGVENQYIALEEVELLQSTGLKDKNGVEIFENNIVNVHEFINVGGIKGYEEGEKETIGIIKYGCLYDSPVPEWYLQTKDDYVSFVYMDLHEESFEIIGNQYNHPHLLKE